MVRDTILKKPNRSKKRYNGPGIINEIKRKTGMGRLFVEDIRNFGEDIQERKMIALGGLCQGDVANFHQDLDWYVLGQKQNGWRQLCLGV